MAISRISKQRVPQLKQSVLGNNFVRKSDLDPIVDVLNGITADTGVNLYAIETGIVAFATGGQTSATLLTEEYNILGTVATAADSVKLPSAVKGAKVTVINRGANAANVFPFSGDAIDDLGADAAFSIAVEDSVTFLALDATEWQSNAEVDSSLTVNTDVINERTAATGVTVEGVLIIDSTVDLNGVADALILDADGDTTLSASTDDTIQIEINSVDDIVLTAGAMTFSKEVNRTITATTTTTAATAGANITITSATGATSGAGGSLNLNGGVGGATGAGGNVVVTSGAGGGTSGASGSITIGSANETAAESSGSLTIQSGTAASSTSGDISILTGIVSVDGKAGDINLTAGSSIGANNGGLIGITAGNASTGSGVGGNLQFTPGEGAINGIEGTAGGQTTFAEATGGTATTGTGGTGSTFSITTGDGGAASGATGTGGNAGSLNLTTGTGGATTDAAGGVENGGDGGNINLTANSGGALAAASTGVGGDGGSVVIASGAGGAAAGGTAGVAGVVKVNATTFAIKQPAPAAKTTDTTLTTAEILGKIITVNQAGGGTSTLTTPTGTALDDALPADFAVDDAFDFHIINISVVAAEDVILDPGVGTSVVGDARVASIDVAGEKTSSGTFRFRKSAINTFIIYRIG